MTYLAEDDEVAGRDANDRRRAADAVERVLSGDDILEFQQRVRQVVVSEDVARYAVRAGGGVAARCSRRQPEFVTK